MDNFKVGDVVVLKLGGIKMVINHIEGDKIETVWIDGKTQEQKVGEFNRAVLKIFEEPRVYGSTSVPVIVSF